MGLFKKIFKAVKKTVKKVATTVTNVVKAVIKDPVPVIAQIAGAAVGIPPAVTAAAVTAARGGDLTDIAKSAAVAYVASSASAPASVTSATTSAGQSVTQSLASTVGQTTAQAVGNATTAALNQGIVGGTTAAITGKDIGQGFVSGAVTGAVASGTGSVFTEVQKDPNWGLSPSTTKVVAGATSAAITAEALGQDSSQAIANYVANSGLQAVKSTATAALSSTDTAQTIKDNLSSIFTPTTLAANQPTPQQIEAQVAKTPEDKVNEFVQQTAGRDATPQEVASLLTPEDIKQITSGAQQLMGGPSVQVAGANQPIPESKPLETSVEVSGVPKFKESLPSDYQPPAGMRVLTGDEASLTEAPDVKATYDPSINQYVWMVPETKPEEPASSLQPLSVLESAPSMASPVVADEKPPIIVEPFVDPYSYAINSTQKPNAPLSTVTQPAQPSQTETVVAPLSGITKAPVDQTAGQTTNKPVTTTVTSPLSGLSQSTKTEQPTITQQPVDQITSVLPSVSEPVTTTVDYGLGPVAISTSSPSTVISEQPSFGVTDTTVTAPTVAQPEEEIPSLSNVDVTATPEEEPLIELPQTTVTSQPVANVTTSPTITVPTSSTTKAPTSTATKSSGFPTYTPPSTSGGEADSAIQPSFLTSTSTGDRFESPLETFLKIQAANPLAYQLAPVQSQAQPKPMNEYYNYGSEQSLDEIMSGSSDEETGMASGGLTGTRYGRYAGGGMTTPLMAAGGKLRVDFRHGDAVTGAGDGQSDDIPAMLADGEFVFPADVVAAIGNGSTKAGSDKLYDMMHSIRAHVRSAKPEDLPPEIKSPLQFLKTKPSRARR
jgi:hypothetical protein